MSAKSAPPVETSSAAAAKTVEDKDKTGDALRVCAAPGRLVPLENRPRAYIDDAAPVSVPDTPYYRRRLADGSLIQRA